MLTYEPEGPAFPHEPGIDTGDARLRALIEHASDVIAILAADGTIRYKSPAVMRVLGYTPDELIGTSAFALVHPDDLPTVLVRFQEVLAQPGIELMVEFRYRHQDGSWHWLEAIGTNRLTDPQVAGIVVNYRDVTERVAGQAALAHQAFHDPLTGLPNRVRFWDHLARCQAPLAVLYLDLDNFKVINDSLGHAAGDQLLVEVGQRLMRCLALPAMVARLGGDEFAILLTDTVALDLTETVAIATRVLTAVSSPIALDQQEVVVTASIGIATTATAGTVVDDLVQAADIALYQAKVQGRAQYAVFTPAMSAAVRGQLELETDLRRAVAREEWQLYYQPMVALASGYVTGVEALVRWDRPGCGLVLPGDFLPVAEEMGILQPIGRWVLAEACRQTCAWDRLLPAGTQTCVSVNLAPPQLRQPGLVAQIAEVLDVSGMPPQQLLLELTEPTLADDRMATRQVLRELKRLGVRVAIDDFGSGASSLSLLRRLAADIDVLKLDRSLILGLTTDTLNRTIVGAIVTLAHALGLVVSIEGIETAADWAAAREIGGDQGQGFFFAPPLPAAEMTNVLARGHPE